LLTHAFYFSPRRKERPVGLVVELEEEPKEKLTLKPHEHTITSAGELSYHLMLGSGQRLFRFV
jgi:hypothetical protein